MILRAALLSAIAVLSRAVIACQCDDRPGITAAAVRSSAVAAGRVESLTPVHGLTVGAGQLESAVIAKMKVEASWKRAVPSLEILTSFSDCDYRDFQIGRRYIVFADPEIAGLGRSERMVWAPRCWPSRELTPLEALPAELGVPIFRQPVQQDHPHASSVPLLPVAALALVLAGAALAFWRR